MHEVRDASSSLLGDRLGSRGWTCGHVGGHVDMWTFGHVDMWTCGHHIRTARSTCTSGPSFLPSFLPSFVLRFLHFLHFLPSLPSPPFFVIIISEPLYLLLQSRSFFPSFTFFTFFTFFRRVLHFLHFLPITSTALY